MSGGMTKVTFKVESQLPAGERLGLIIHGEFGRLLEVVLSSSGRMHFTHPIPLTTLDRVEYSYVILSDTQSVVRWQPRPRSSSGKARPPSPLTAAHHTHTATPTPTLSPSWARRGTARWSPRAWKCWCRTR